MSSHLIAGSGTLELTLSARSLTDMSSPTIIRIILQPHGDNYAQNKFDIILRKPSRVCDLISGSNVSIFPAVISFIMSAVVLRPTCPRDSTPVHTDPHRALTALPLCLQLVRVICHCFTWLPLAFFSLIVNARSDSFPSHPCASGSSFFRRAVLLSPFHPAFVDGVMCSCPLFV